MYEEIIKKGNEIIESGNVECAKMYVDLILGKYENDVKSIKYDLDRQSAELVANPHKKVDHIGDLRKLINCLKMAERFPQIDNHKDAGKNEAGMITNNIYNINNNTNTANSSMTISSIIENVKKDENMNDSKEREELIAKLKELDEIDPNEENESKWKKVSRIISWVADKGYKIAAPIIEAIKIIM